MINTMATHRNKYDSIKHVQMDKTHKMNWKWQNMKFKIQKVKFEGKWNHSVKQAERLWLSIIISKTGGINYTVLGLTQTKTIKISRWFYNAATLNTVHRELRRSKNCSARLTRCWARALTVHSCVTSCEDAFPSVTSATICALETGQQRSCSSHWWFMDQTAGVN